MYEAIEGTVLAALLAGAVFALTRQPDPELLTPEPITLALRWPGRLRPGHRRAAESAADTEADDFIGALHGRPPGGRHRRPGPPNLKLSRNDLPHASETVPVAQAPGHPPWDVIPGHPELVLRTCNESAYQTFTLEPGPALGSEAAVTRDPEPPPALPGVYTGPEQKEPPTSVMRVRDILNADLGGYLRKLPEYPED